MERRESLKSSASSRRSSRSRVVPGQEKSTSLEDEEARGFANKPLVGDVPGSLKNGEKKLEEEKEEMMDGEEEKRDGEEGR